MSDIYTSIRETNARIEEDIVIAPVTPDIRQRLAMLALKGRLGFAIRAGRTDSFALYSARGWAEKAGYKGSLKTMKQALRWVESQLAE